VDARTLQRIGLLAVCAALASGCAPLRGTVLEPVTAAKPAPNPPGAGAGAVVPVDAIGGGQVVSAGAAQPGAAQPDLLATPRPLPAAPGDPFPPMMPPPLPPVTKFASPTPADPHQRVTPTATGGRLALAPNEMSTDRIVELTLHLERLTKYNDALAGRIKELENAGAGRDQALDEAARAVAAATAETEKTRAALQAQVVRLQAKIKDLEEEDIALLREIIKALGPFAPPEKK
jgi:uncharacterized coiled-coil protein SlyX